MKNYVEFNFDQMHELSQLILGLNVAGVPYTIAKDNCAISVCISDGF
jgi:hypothetical protein